MANEAPPAYEQVANAADAPPSYDQLFGVTQMKQQMMEARTSSSNQGMFAVKFCEILCGSIACMLCLIILAALPIVMIVIGSIKIDDCPLEDRIPIFLIVFGVVSLVQTIINIIKRIFRKKKGDGEEEEGQSDYANRGGSCLETFLSIFLFIWIIIGSVWVFGNYDDWNDCNRNCCDSLVYLFSFITLIVMYVISFLVCCCCCCIFCIIALAGVEGE